jgi:hypothetical protein
MPSTIRVRASQSLRSAAQAMFVIAFGALLASACGSSGNSSVDPGGSGGASAAANGNGASAGKGAAGHGGSAASGGNMGNQAEAGEAGAAGEASTPLLPDCQAVYTSCDSLCGPVHDPCTGQNFECGACATGMACDRDTHACIAPKLTCADLGAECGKIRNTCGERLDCGDCTDGQECDPDTNKCAACSNPTCKDLGFECGVARLR